MKEPPGVTQVPVESLVKVGQGHNTLFLAGTHKAQIPQCPWALCDLVPAKRDRFKDWIACLRRRDGTEALGESPLAVNAPIHVLHSLHAWLASTDKTWPVFI